MSRLIKRPRIQGVSGNGPLLSEQLTPIRIDKNHPHLQGCVSLCLPVINDGTQVLTDLMGGPDHLLNNTPTWNTRRELTCSSGSSQSIPFSTDQITNTYPFAFRYIAKHETGVTNCYMSYGGTASDSNYARLTFTSANKVGLANQVNGSGTNSATSVTTVTGGEYYDVMGIFYGTGSLKIYLNGHWEAADASGGVDLSGNPYNTAHFSRLQRTGNNYYNSDGVRLLQIWHNTDPAQLAMDMYMNPYDFIKSRGLIYPDASGGGYWGLDHYLKHIAGM